MGTPRVLALIASQDWMIVPLVKKPAKDDLKKQVLERAREIFAKENGRAWDDRGREEYRAKLAGRLGLERDAADVLKKLRSTAKEAQSFADAHTKENLVAANPASELIGWVHQYRDAVRALTDKPGIAGARRSNAERTIIVEMFGIHLLSDVRTKPVLNVAPVRVESAVLLPPAKLQRPRSSRELAAIGLLCAIWDEKYDSGAYSAAGVLTEEARMYQALLRGRRNRKSARSGRRT